MPPHPAGSPRARVRRGGRAGGRAGRARPAGDELAELLADAYPERPSAEDIARTYRRRAHLLTHLATAHPEYEAAARSAVEHWQQAEGDALTEAVALHAVASR
ncbi:hypothetical protein IHE61_30980 [Streptomyces sp. GKU 257-1]|nr:hypothetical protein [Streptomyces sp. GKU 257-1]